MINLMNYSSLLGVPVVGWLIKKLSDTMGKEDTNELIGLRMEPLKEQIKGLEDKIDMLEDQVRRVEGKVDKLPDLLFSLLKRKD